MGGDYSPYFCNWNANKRSIAMDLGRSEGRDLLLRMLPRYDIVIENFGPGVIEKLDLGYQTRKANRPALIFV